MRKRKWGIMFAAGLTAFTVFISLDTFVLSSAYQVNATEMNTAMFENEVDSNTSASSDEETVKTGQETSADENSGTIPEEISTDKNTSDESDGDTKERPSSGKKHRPGSKSSRKGNTSENGQSDSGTGSQFGEESGSTADSESVTDTGTGSGSSYSDENAEITVQEYDVNGTAVYVADVQLSSAQYLKTAFADDTYGKNVTEKTSEIAAAHDAVLAINGDYYGTQETGYVIRNGVIYRDQAGDSDVLCIYADGTMKVVSPSEYTAQELVDQGVWQAFSFGPSLVEEGTVAVSEDTEVGKAMSSNPRTAIGIIDDLHYVFVVSDGRTDESEGLSLYELADFMEKQLGVKTAYNLDGGGSSTMYFEGSVINNPTTNGRIKERSVSDIVYI